MVVFEPLFLSTHDACDMLGVKRTLLFRYLREGVLERRKHGRKTVVTMASIKRFAAGETA